MWKLFLDDYRIPSDVPILHRMLDSTLELTVARTAKEAMDLIEERGCPNFISFDHDLAEDHYAPTDSRYVPPSKQMTGYDFAKWIVFKDNVANGKFIPEDFKYHVHSMNPVGAENIRKLLESYLEYRQGK